MSTRVLGGLTLLCTALFTVTMLLELSPQQCGGVAILAAVLVFATGMRYLEGPHG